MCRTGDVWGDFELWGQGHSLNSQFARRPKSVLIRFVGFSGLPSHMPHRFWPFNRSATAFGPFRVRQMAPTCWDILDFLRSLPQSRNRRFLQDLTYIGKAVLPVPSCASSLHDDHDWWLLEFAGLESEECSEFTGSMDSLLSPSEASRKISRTSKLGENIEYATSGRQTSASCSVKDFWVDFCLHEWTLWDFRNPQDVSTLMWQHWCLKFGHFFGGSQHARFFCSAFLFVSGLGFYRFATGPRKVPLRTVWCVRGPWTSKSWREWIHNHPHCIQWLNTWEVDSRYIHGQKTQKERLDSFINLGI